MNTTRAEPSSGIGSTVHSVLAVFFQRNLVPVVMTGDGVSTYLALIFGTLLSSQGTVASFVLTRETLSRLSSGRFPSVLRFRLYQILSASDSQSAGVVFPAVEPFRRVRL
jgi:hypothetical protein